MNSFSNFTVEPLFATPLAMLNLAGDPTLTKESLADIDDWNVVNGLGISPGYHFLSRHPVLEAQILEAFSFFKDNYLGLSDVEFGMAASWMTLCEPGCTGVSHRHYNSMFTGVYYPFEDEYSPLEFSRTGLEPTSFLIERNQTNIYSMSSAQLSPYQSFAVFFPSYVIHRITHNTSEKVRHSVAFNFHPIGPIGTSDSSVHVIGVKPRNT
jgi:uncharacterized protein (TIGR02466 family)